VMVTVWCARLWDHDGRSRALHRSNNTRRQRHQSPSTGPRKPHSVILTSNVVRARTKRPLAHAG
jgi:hypothetical protein